MARLWSPAARGSSAATSSSSSRRRPRGGGRRRSLARERSSGCPKVSSLDSLDIRDRRGFGSVVGGCSPGTRSCIWPRCTSFPTWTERPSWRADVNVRGTRAMLAMRSADAPPSRLLSPRQPPSIPTGAARSPRPARPAPVDVYGRTKLEGETLVERFGEATRTSVVLARIFNVVGPRETNAHVVPDLVGQLRAGAGSVRLGNLDSRRDYTDVRDVANALARLLALDSSSVLRVNIGSGRAVSVGNLVEACARVLGRRIDVEVEPARRRAVDRKRAPRRQRRASPPHRMGADPLARGDARRPPRVAGGNNGCTRRPFLYSEQVRGPVIHAGPVWGPRLQTACFSPARGTR